MSKQHEKDMADLRRLLETQDFKSFEDMQKFMDGFIGQQIPSFPKEALSPKEQAQDLVFEAYEVSKAKGLEKIDKALELDIDCIEAYEYLGAMEESVFVAMVFFEKAISIGRRLFGGKYLKENKGMFWGLHETRPFMRCLHVYADCLYAVGKAKECLEMLEEMIELNPNDNQGARDQLFLYLIEYDENKKYLNYAKQYKDDFMAFSLFNAALFEYKTQGPTLKAGNCLVKAHEQNKFVIGKLISNKPVFNNADSYALHSEDEAKYIASYAQIIWRETTGALQWLKGFNVKG
jgi:tetratricopeptide (TPR) repeat protein